MDELPEGLDARIDDLAEAGNELLDEEGDWQGAIAMWEQALALLPPPHNLWPQTVWLQASIGTAWREGGDDARALAAFQAAYHAPDGVVNPYVLLNLGILTRPQDERAGLDFLLRAYMLAGEDLFEGEDDALDFLARHVDLSEITPPDDEGEDEDGDGGEDGGGKGAPPMLH